MKFLHFLLASVVICANAKSTGCKLPSHSGSKEGCKQFSSGKSDCCAGFACENGSCISKGKSAINTKIEASALATVSHLNANDAAEMANALKDKIDNSAAAILLAEQKLEELDEAVQSGIKEEKRKIGESIGKTMQRINQAKASEATVEEEAKQLAAILADLKEETSRLYEKSQKGFDSSYRDTETSKKGLATEDVVQRIREFIVYHAATPSTNSKQQEVDKLEKEMNSLKKELGSHHSASDSKAGNMQGQLTPGSEGGPCGKTLYKDFGDCNGKHLKCQETDNTYGKGWIPGTCKKKGDEKENIRRQLQTMDIPSMGDLNGPCGKTMYFNFGPCRQDLHCKTSAKPTIEPGICKNRTQSASSVQVTDEITKTADNKQNARNIALAANKLAQDTANAIDIIAKSFHTSAENLRQAADVLISKVDEESKELEAEAKPMPNDEFVTNSQISSTGHIHLSGLWNLASLLVIIGCVAVAMNFLWRNRSGYQRI